MVVSKMVIYYGTICKNITIKTCIQVWDSMIGSCSGILGSWFRLTAVTQSSSPFYWNPTKNAGMLFNAFHTYQDFLAPPQGFRWRGSPKNNGYFWQELIQQQHGGVDGAEDPQNSFHPSNWGGAFIHVRMYRKVTFVNNGMANYQTQLVCRISEPSTVAFLVFILRESSVAMATKTHQWHEPWNPDWFVLRGSGYLATGYM